MEHGIDHSRDERGDGHPLPLDRLQDLGRLERGEKDMPRAHHCEGKGCPKITDVEHWRCVQIGIARADPKGHNRMHGVGDEILLGEHGAFGSSCGAASVKQPEEILVVDLLVGTTAPGHSLLDQVFVMVHTCGCLLSGGATVDEMLDARWLLELRDKGGKVLVNDQDSGLAVIENEVDFWWGQAYVERHDHDPHASAGVVEFEVAVAIEHEYRDPVTALEI